MCKNADLCTDITSWEKSWEDPGAPGREGRKVLVSARRRGKGKPGPYNKAGHPTFEPGD